VEYTINYSFISIVFIIVTLIDGYVYIPMIKDLIKHPKETTKNITINTWLWWFFSGFVFTVYFIIEVKDILTISSSIIHTIGCLIVVVVVLNYRKKYNVYLFYKVENNTKILETYKIDKRNINEIFLNKRKDLENLVKIDKSEFIEEKDIKKWITANVYLNRELYVVKNKNKEVIGCYKIEKTKEKVLLSYIYIKKEFQRNKIGKTIIKQIEKEIELPIYIEVNDKDIDFYKKCNCREITNKYNIPLMDESGKIIKTKKSNLYLLNSKYELPEKLEDLEKIEKEIWKTYYGKDKNANI